MRLFPTMADVDVGFRNQPARELRSACEKPPYAPVTLQSARLYGVFSEESSLRTAVQLTAMLDPHAWILV